MTRADRSRRSLPLLLIGLGVLLLVAHLGWLRLDLWALLQLWPLALVAVGVDILLGGRYRLAVVLGTLVAGAALSVGGAGLGAADTRTERVAQPLGGARTAVLELQTGVGDLRLNTSGDPDMLISGTVQAARGERITQTFREGGGAASFALRSERRGGVGAVGGRRLWNLSLTPAVPLELRVETGVGRATLELENAQLTELQVSTGVGDALLTLPRAGRYEATLETGVGAATVRIPDGVAVRLTVSRGVGTVTVRGNFGRDGERYLSPDYATAEHRVDLRVNGGVGAITIEQGG